MHSVSTPIRSGRLSLGVWLSRMVLCIAAKARDAEPGHEHDPERQRKVHGKSEDRHRRQQQGGAARVDSDIESRAHDERQSARLPRERRVHPSTSARRSRLGPRWSRPSPITGIIETKGKPKKFRMTVTASVPAMSRWPRTCAKPSRRLCSHDVPAATGRLAPGFRVATLTNATA